MMDKAVIFDLYGTLVGNFSRQAYDNVQKQMAEILGVPYPKFWRTLEETFKDRAIGSLSFEENVVAVCRRLGVNPDKTHIERTAALNSEFTRESLIPPPEVLAALSLLKRNGFRTGLITNCNANVPRLFPDSPLARYIDVPVFSCEEQLKKPSHRIYEIACERLSIAPHACFYVGDGSSQELTGAAAVGMLPILKRTDLSDVYDPHRPDVQNWQGIAIESLSEVCPLVFELSKEEG